MTTNSTLTPRQELIALLRGFFACPIISQLATCGLLDRMQDQPFSVIDLSVDRPAVAQAVINYLSSLGLVEPFPDSDKYSATQLGQKVFARAGAFSILRSYQDYIDNLPQLLSGDEVSPKVDRLLNVFGSGRLHSRKFFQPAIEMLPAKLSQLIDLGCGNGDFIDVVMESRHPEHIVTIDLSSEAVEMTCRRFPSASTQGIVANAEDVSTWSAQILPVDGTTVISAWFVMHEFCNSNVSAAATFLTELWNKFPRADVLLGEIISVECDLLAANHSASCFLSFFCFMHSLGRVSSGGISLSK